MKADILKAVDDAIRATNLLKSDICVDFMLKASRMISNCFSNGGKLIIAGNGGSLCDAMHFAEELTAYFREKRKALPAIVLSEAGHLTAVSNDTDYDSVFERGVEAFLKKEDIFISLTTSGNSKNIFKGINKAKELNGKTISFLGKTGGIVKGLSDLEIIIEGFKYSDRIQEAHMTMIHIIIEMVEKIMFSPKETLKKMISKELLKNL